MLRTACFLQKVQKVMKARTVGSAIQLRKMLNELSKLMLW